MRAWESGAPDSFASVLREDAILTMPPMAAWIRGREAIVDFSQWLRSAMGEVKAMAAIANGEPAVAMYVRAPGTAVFRAAGIHVPVFEGDRIAEVHAFLLPHLFARFGLPDIA